LEKAEGCFVYVPDDAHDAKMRNESMNNMIEKARFAYFIFLLEIVYKFFTYGL
jgi:hypothetical protein